MCLFDSETQRVEFFCGYSDGTSDPQILAIEDKFQVDFAGIVDIVDNDCYNVLQFEWNVADSVADANIGYLLHLASYFLEEKMALLSGDLR